MSTSTAAQQPPDPSRDLTHFPGAFLTAGRQLRRAHRRKNDVWYFSSGTNRFDLDGPDGSCYLADDVETAVREHLRDAVLDRSEVSETRAREFCVTEVTTALSGWFAQIVASRAARFGVTRELGTMVDPGYAVPRAWARALHAVGRVGVRYASRFTTSAAANSWALFGPEGQRPASDSKFQRGRVVDGVAACREAGIAVLPIPYTGKRLTILK